MVPLLETNSVHTYHLLLLDEGGVSRIDRRDKPLKFELLPQVLTEVGMMMCSYLAKGKWHFDQERLKLSFDYLG